ncbi:MAG TPA: MFS transporter [Pseudonocardiaceae bacterium]
MDPAQHAQSVWRDGPFQLFWTGQTISSAGSQVTLVVLPVLIFQLTGSAGRTAALLTVEAAPYLVFGLFAGAITDRANRRLVMITCDLSRSFAVATVALAAALDVLTIPHVYLVAAITGTAFVWHDSGLFGALPAIVGRARVTAAFGALISGEQVLRIGATALGGGLVATLGAAPALWMDAASYALAATTLALVPRPFGTGEVPPRTGTLFAITGRDIAAGLRYLRRHPVIWPLTVTGAGNALSGGAVLGLLVVYGVRQLGLTDDYTRLGLLFSAGGIGALCAGLSLALLGRRVTQTRITLVALPVNVITVVVLALITDLPTSLLLLFIFGGTTTLIITNGIALRQQLTPDRLQGRVNVTARLIAYSGTPIGAALGGLIADHTSISVTYLIMAFGSAAATFYAWTSPLRTTDEAAIIQFKNDAEQAC